MDLARCASALRGKVLRFNRSLIEQIGERIEAVGARELDEALRQRRNERGRGAGTRFYVGWCWRWRSIRWLGIDGWSRRA
jgi:hypothetical protein